MSGCHHEVNFEIISIKIAINHGNNDFLVIEMLESTIPVTRVGR